MADILVAFGTKEGHTAKVAARVAEVARARGHDADVREIASLPSDFSLEGVDGVAIGASVHVGQHQPQVVEFARRHARALEGVPSDFFSVSLSAADPDPKGQEQARAYVANFTSEAGWTPDVSATVAGALVYTQYDFFTRLLVRLIASRGGMDTDTHHDFDYTDWGAVERFAEAFVRRVEESPRDRAQQAPSRAA